VIGSTRKSWIHVVPGVVLMTALGSVMLFGVDTSWLHGWLDGVNGALFCVLVAVLPIVGFPVTVLQIMAGLKFGFWGGTAVITASMFCHLLGSYWMGTGILRGPLARLLSRTKYRLPDFSPGQQNTIALLLPFLPGSYTLKNYLMVLGGVSLRSLLCVALPVYAVRASSGIFLGDAAANPSTWLFVVLIGARVSATAISAWILKRYGRGLKLSVMRTPEAEPEGALALP